LNNSLKRKCKTHRICHKSWNGNLLYKLSWHDVW